MASGGGRCLMRAGRRTKERQLGHESIDNGPDMQPELTPESVPISRPPDWPGAPRPSQGVPVDEMIAVEVGSLRGVCSGASLSEVDRQERLPFGVLCRHARSRSLTKIGPPTGADPCGVPSRSLLQTIWAPSLKSPPVAPMSDPSSAHVSANFVPVEFALDLSFFKRHWPRTTPTVGQLLLDLVDLAPQSATSARLTQPRRRCGHTRSKLCTCVES